MYTLKSDGRLVAQSAAGALAFVSGSSLLERVSCAEQGSVTLRPENDRTGYVASRTSVITIERAGTELFRGQAVDVLENEQGFVRFSLLGEMSFLRDGLIAPFEYSGSANNLILQVLTEYNAQVASARQIGRGTIGKTGLGVSLTYRNTGWRSAWDIIQDLYNLHGGFLRIRPGDNGGRVLDWLDDSNHFSEQPILWGDNLLRLNVLRDATGIVNSIRATAGQDLSTLVEDADSIARYGSVRVHRTYDAETVEDLQALAQADLANAKDEALQLSGYAVDKWRQGYEPFRVGDFAETVSRRPDVDQWIMVTELKHDLTGGTPTQVTLGLMPDAITRTERSGVINKWILSRQGRSPELVLMSDKYYHLMSDSTGRLAAMRRS